MVQIEQRPVSNFTDKLISVEFLVVHHTGVSLNETLAIFNRDNCGSAHLVIDRNGQIYECVPCWDGKPLRAWHAGVSRWLNAGQTFEGFNDLSIGIELVNLNGNLFTYTDQQYTALISSIQQLASFYPALKKPERILGHDHISGFRGKCDPGLLFEWDRISQALFNCSYPLNKPTILSSEIILGLSQIYSALPEQMIWDNGNLAAKLSSLAELCTLALLKSENQATCLNNFTQHAQGLKQMLESLEQPTAIEALDSLEAHINRTVNT